MAGLAAWLWPIGVGGRMPVGGDVTNFSIGLMAVLGRALRAGRLPLWNDLWGYGFPGLAESQMGVFYPPHLILYGWLPTEGAYTVSLVLHTAFGALGAAWAARRFGVGEMGAALAGFVWATSGFFVAHLPHQWGYTVGAWMPWAWGLAWGLLRGDGPRWSAWILAAVLAVQVLPGHFQLAFETQVGLLGLALWSLIDPPGGGPRPARGAVAVGLAIGAVLPLSAMQLWPTWRLAARASAGRDPAYLAEFAATPLHLVSYLAPGLFHRSPLWRPVAWDPFHTSPEEHLAYVGLVPLFLALGAVRRGWRADPTARALMVLAAGSLWLSLGPYAPGFGLVSRLPGFSFFRAPARWSLVSALALALLAGKGFDALAGWPRPGRALGWFAALAMMAPMLVLAGFELALASTRGPGPSVVASGFDWAMRQMPWEGDPPFREVMARARRPQDDLRVHEGQARAGLGPVPRGGLSLERERFGIYVLELRETAALLAGLLALVPLSGRVRSFRAGLIVLTATDLVLMGHHRTIDAGPIRPLSEQSRVLAALADAPRGTRVVAGLGNLPMVAGTDSIAAYRTLDLPVVPGLTGMAQGPLRHPGLWPAVAAMRATGAAVRVLDPFERAEAQPLGPASVDQGRGKVSLVDPRDRTEVIADPALASWTFGAPWVATRPAESWKFALWRPEPERAPARAWLISRNVDEDFSTDLGPDAILAVFELAAPLSANRIAPEHVEIPEVSAQGPALVLLTQLDDPEWRAEWISAAGRRPAPIGRAFGRPGAGAWQVVRVPEGGGPWSLRLVYEGRAVRQGLIVSAAAWTLGIVAFFWPRRRGREQGGRT